MKTKNNKNFFELHVISGNMLMYVISPISQFIYRIHNFKWV